MKPLLYLAAAQLCLCLAAPAAFAAFTEPEMFPLMAEEHQFQGETLSDKTLKRIYDAFNVAGPVYKKRGGPKLAKTDVGYGAQFRVRYDLKDAYVVVYSGEMDGSLTEMHFKPRPLEAAKQFAIDLEKSNKDALQVNFQKVAEKTANSVTYQSEATGCVAAYTFVLDAHGRCIEIDSSTAC